MKKKHNEKEEEEEEYREINKFQADDDFKSEVCTAYLWTQK